jgi:hypothetical protein
MAKEVRLQRREVPAVWAGLEESPVFFTNAFLGVLDDQGEVILCFGQSNPPVFTGPTPEKLAEQASKVTSVNVKPVARLSMSRQRLRELVDVLNLTIRNQEAMDTAMKSGGR